MHRSRTLGLVALLGFLAACGSSASPGTASQGLASGRIGAPPAGAKIEVVASLNAWGDIARQIGGDHVAVKSIIDDPAADPHSFEASPQTQLALSRARLVIRNGGGYDDFVTEMLEAGKGTAVVIDAVEISGKSGDDLNEHVWYDLPTAKAVAARVSAGLSKADPANQKSFQANLATFTTGVVALEQQQASIKATAAGAQVVVTEPVPTYLLTGAGLTDVTPAAFTEAIEAETDVPAAAFAATKQLISGGSVRMLVQNSQTSGPQIEQLLAEALRADVPVVGVTETLPAGQTYLGWMKANLDAVAAALGAGT